MEFQHVIYGIERTIHSREKRRVKNGWVTRYYPFRIGRWKVHQRSASCRRGKVNGGWIELDSGGGGEGEDGETMGWFEIPVGVSIEGMYPRFEANFSICLEKSRPWANAPNQYTRQANPPRVSPFPTGNTCKPRLYQPFRIPEGVADGGTPNLELDFTWNELLPVVGAEFREEGIGAEAINRRKISVPSRGGGGKTTRAIDSKSDYEEGGKRCSSVVVELQIRYRDKEEGETIYICTQLQFEKRWRILMTGRLPLIRNTSIILLLSLIWSLIYLLSINNGKKFII